nr:hypothetical protein BaRGS_000154 [Batillaria attramentaria]
MGPASTDEKRLEQVKKLTDQLIALRKSALKDGVNDEQLRKTLEEASQTSGTGTFAVLWQRSNCHKEVTKQLRQHYQRPYFLPPDSESVDIDWIFMGGAGSGAPLHCVTSVIRSKTKMPDAAFHVESRHTMPGSGPVPPLKPGVRHFAVATAYEGRELRQAGIQGFIQVFGNCVGEEMDIMRQFQLTPTVTTEAFLTHWAAWPSYTLAEQQSRNSNIPQVVIKVDSGMSRNGCQPEELPTLMDLCSELGVPVHSLMTHFAQAWDDPHFTLKQLDTFLSAVQPYRKQGVKLHAANSCGIIRGFGTSLDLVRPGICLYGLPPDPSEETVKTVEEFGLRPALSWIARPNMVKHLKPGRHVGYDQTYRLEKEETIATFALGYADGYSRQLSGKGILTTAEGV